jgi:chemotaxis response regulator CheB
MSYRETEHLRVLIANERKDQLALVAPMVGNLGHEVIAREIDVADVGDVTARERPDVALVGLGQSSEHALALIDKIVRKAACPVILLIHAPDPAFVKEASKRGTSPTSPTPRSTIGRARSTSCFAGSPSTTTSRARLAAERSSSERRAS